MKTITITIDDQQGGILTRKYGVNDNLGATEVWGTRVNSMLDTLEQSKVAKF